MARPIASMPTAALPLLAALLCCPATVRAQDAPPPGDCPQLPAGAGLAWESSNMGESDFCRAVRGDGSEAFGLYISPEPNFKPRSHNREETTRIGDHEVRWYRAEIAASPGVQARETLLPLVDGRKAHIWLQAGSNAELAASYALVARLRFEGGMEIVAE